MVRLLPLENKASFIQSAPPETYRTLKISDKQRFVENFFLGFS